MHCCYRHTLHVFPTICQQAFACSAGKDSILGVIHAWLAWQSRFCSPSSCLQQNTRKPFGDRHRNLKRILRQQAIAANQKHIYPTQQRYVVEDKDLMASGVCRIAHKVRCMWVPGMASCAAGTSHKALMALLMQTSMLGQYI